MQRAQGLTFKIYSINNADETTNRLITKIYIKYL